jgi:hypothetical protein
MTLPCPPLQELDTGVMENIIGNVGWAIAVVPVVLVRRYDD